MIQNEQVCLCQDPRANGRFQCEQVLVSIQSNAILGVGRDFIVVCPSHGRRIVQLIGHHSTLAGDAGLKRRWSKAERAKIKSQLNGQELEAFLAAVEGKQMASDGQIQTWQQLLLAGA